MHKTLMILNQVGFFPVSILNLLLHCKNSPKVNPRPCLYTKQASVGLVSAKNLGRPTLLTDAVPVDIKADALNPRPPVPLPNLQQTHNHQCPSLTYDKPTATSANPQLITNPQPPVPIQNLKQTHSYQCPSLTYK